MAMEDTYSDHAQLKTNDAFVAFSTAVKPPVAPLLTPSWARGGQAETVPDGNAELYAM